MCTGAIRKNLYLGHQFQTDVLLLRLEFGKDITFEPQRPWLSDALSTCAEGLVLGSSLALSIDPGELSSGLDSCHRPKAVRAQLRFTSTTQRPAARVTLTKLD